MKLPMMSSAEKAMESGMVRTRCQKVSGGITWAVVLPISAETGTMRVAVGAQGVDERASAATVAERSPPPSCMQDDGAAELRLGLHGLQLGEHRRR